MISLSRWKPRRATRLQHTMIGLAVGLSQCRAAGRDDAREQGTSTSLRPSAAPAAELDAGELDALGRDMLNPRRDRLLRPTDLVARLGLSPTAIVADIGAGPGYLTLPLARAVPRGRVIATDIRRAYLDVTMTRAHEAGLDNVEARLVPADAPALDSHSIDLAVLCQVDHFLPDRAAYLKALRGSLRPGGRIALVNDVGRRQADLDAARSAGLRVVDEWQPSPLYFLLVLVSA